jgi:precorrin-3B methylase
MTLGSHLTPLAKSYIEKSDVVFAATSDGIIEMWLAGLHPDVRSFQPLYQEGKPRMETYRQMVEAMLTEVRAGKRVCGAFYGHPGVFAWPPHKALEIARKEGYRAHMEPGISAEDCLYADLGSWIMRSSYTRSQRCRLSSPLSRVCHSARYRTPKLTCI